MTNFALNRRSCAVSTSARKSLRTANCPMLLLTGLTTSPDCALKSCVTTYVPDVHPPAGVGPNCAGLYIPDAASAAAAALSAAASGEPGVVGVGAVAALCRAIAYASSRLALAARARLNDPKVPGDELGPAATPTPWKPAGSTTGGAVAPAVLRLSLAVSSRATM